jgi:hypothetical protein
VVAFQKNSRVAKKVKSRLYLEFQIKGYIRLLLQRIGIPFRYKT